MLRLMVLAVCAVALSGPPDQKPLLVSAAISLTDALREIAQAYRAAGGGPVDFNFGGSNVLARQIVNGAPADLFISADDAQMDYAQQRGGIDPGSRTALLANRLAVVEPRGRRRHLRDVRGLLDPGIRRIAIGDPAAVPAGIYARQYLERSGLWTSLQPKLLPLANVRAALAAAESAGVDAAFVYASDVASADVRLAFVIADANAPRIIYPAAVTRTSKNVEDAKRFLAFLQGTQAQAIFGRFKFSSPSAASARTRDEE